MSDKTIIETKHVTKRFGGLTAVDGVTYEVREGQSVGIIGPNGAGKTTFFNILTGMYAPEEGSVLFLGKNITRSSSFERTRMGIVRTFQLVSVFGSLKVIDNLVLSNVRFAKQHGSMARFFLADAHQRKLMDLCMNSLAMMGIGDKAHLMTSELSYGDKRKLEIAMALSLKPKILLLDEPFAGLSDAEIVEVLGLINRVKSGFTLVIIEHKISRIVDLVEKLSVMHEGRLIAEGAPSQVLSDPTVREVYWGKEESLTCSV